MFLGLLRYLLKNRPSVLLSPFEVTSVIAILAKKISGAPTRVVIRVSVHISRNKRTAKWKKILEKLVVSRVYPLADGIITVSEGVAEDLALYTGIPLERIKVIYNPVISDQLMQAAEQPVHHRFFAEGQYPVFLGVGRLAEQKDFSTLIKAFDILHRKIPSRLIILGEGEERSALEALIRSCGLQEMVDLPGVDTNPFAYMKHSSAFVLSSKWEGLPGVLIQALACGCPVVSTDCLSGPAEILKDGEYGYLVPVGDVNAMAVAMEAILRGDVRRTPEGWLEQFTLSAVIPQYRAVFNI
jgi:glycosyltransferase involved in cell wall biosynthesis